jgi:SulP family sulfate permease
MEVGLATACVVFVYRMSTLFTVKSDDAPSQPPDVMPYALHGPLFFGAVNKIESLPDELPSGIAAVVLDATDLLSIDSSGIAAVENVQRTLDPSGTRLFLVNANARCSEAVRRAGLDGLLAQEGARRP